MSDTLFINTVRHPNDLAGPDLATIQARGGLESILDNRRQIGALFINTLGALGLESEVTNTPNGTCLYVSGSLQQVQATLPDFGVEKVIAQSTREGDDSIDAEALPVLLGRLVSSISDLHPAETSFVEFVQTLITPFAHYWSPNAQVQIDVPAHWPQRHPRLGARVITVAQLKGLRH